ncbi:hypothetical protein QLX08_010387 [Tetragonisca angustula]|uniref:Uncharacterized protein n=1 Tax=Tetragonisca angustula TaxID=166442 RepID=A0AAW0ZCD9_9HYME
MKIVANKLSELGLSSSSSSSSSTPRRSERVEKPLASEPTTTFVRKNVDTVVSQDESDHGCESLLLLPPADARRD